MSTVTNLPLGPAVSATAPDGRPFRFQYKGLYPALNEASRVSYSYRTKLRYFVGEHEYLGWEIRKLALDTLFFEQDEE